MIKDFLKEAAYLIKPRPLRLEYPTVVQFPVVDICNSKCQMCKIWENRGRDEIQIDNLRSGLRNRLFKHVRGVGVNGGEPTLRRDLADLVKVLCDELPRLETISLITNALNSRQVIERLREVKAVTRERRVKLDVMVSLDGYGAVHDLVRGRPGNFEHACKVLDYLQKQDGADSIRLGCTVIRDNALHLWDLFDFARDRGLYIKYRLGVPHQRLYTKDLVEPYALTFEEKYEFATFLGNLVQHYEKSAHQKFFYRSLIGQLMYDSKRAAGCDWKHRGATITARGELLYCAVESPVLTPSITNVDVEKIYFSSRPVLEKIVETKCDSCNHDYVGIPPRGQHAKQLSLQIARKLGGGDVLNRGKAAAAVILNKIAYIKAKRVMAHSISEGLARSRCEGRVQQGFRKILICGWYGTETLGDKAILGGVISSLREELGDDVRISVMSLYPHVSEMTKLQMPELADAELLPRSEVGPKFGQFDLFIFGGGPMMAVNEIGEIAEIFSRAKQTGKRVVLAGVGIGPFGRNYINKDIERIVALADGVVYRDAASQEKIHSRGTRGGLEAVADDPALTWITAQAATDCEVLSTRGKPILLLGLREFPWRQYAVGHSAAEAKAIAKKYEDAVGNALHACIKIHPNLLIRPLPMCTNSYGDDDRWYYRSMFSKWNLPASNLQLDLLGPEMPPLHYLDAFKSATAVLGMRFHSLVFALGAGIPVVGLDYTLGKGKISALAKQNDFPCLALQSIDSGNLIACLGNALSAGRKIEPPTPKFPEAFHSVISRIQP